MFRNIIQLENITYQIGTITAMVNHFRFVSHRRCIAGWRLYWASEYNKNATNLFPRYYELGWKNDVLPGLVTTSKFKLSKKLL